MQELPPIPNDFTHVIAHRMLELVSSTETASLTLEIGAPVQDVASIGGMDWRCPIRITHRGYAEVTSLCGIDAFQALQLAVGAVAGKLEAVAAQHGASLRFLGEEYDLVAHLPFQPTSPLRGAVPWPPGKDGESKA